MRIFLFLTITLSNLIVFASSAENSVGHQGVPKVVFFQVINVSIIFIAFYWYGKDRVKKYFESKRTAFVEAQEQSKMTLKKAEQDHHDVKTKLEKLQSNKVDTLSKAKNDAIELHDQIVKDAKTLSEKVIREAEVITKVELERAKTQLRIKLINEASLLSQKDLASRTTSEDLKRLQKSFINKVKVNQ